MKQTILKRARRWAQGLLIAAVAMSETACTPDRQDDGPLPPPELRNIRALGRIKRVDLVWERGDALFFEIERRGPGEKEFHRINKLLWTTDIYSDYLGKTAGSYAYRARAVFVAGTTNIELSAWSPVVTAAPHAGSDEDLLTEVQEATFRYFYNYRHPVSGLAMERTPFRKVEKIEDITPEYIKHIRYLNSLCATGATGMGMFNLVVGVERGFISREQGAAWALQMLRFLNEKAQHYRGAFAHWINGDTGATYPFAGKEDDGADLVETAFLAAGFIELREYFSGPGEDEKEIRNLADGLWRGIEWNRFVPGKSPGGALFWHWSPNYGWTKNLPVRGFNEAHILYLLALASPTHPIEMRSYTEGWLTPWYGSQRTAFGIPLKLEHGLGGPLFFTQYSYMGFDPAAISYKGETYAEHFRKLCEVQVRYARSKAEVFKGYGDLWGLTSSADPAGYAEHAPGPRDNGTVAPTAALSAMPYTPKAGRKFLQVLYNNYADFLWQDFGFADAFNLSRNWVADSLIGIDAGPIAPMIENQRSGICRKVFMRAPEISNLVKRLQ